MYVIPIKIKDDPTGDALIVILGKDNLERMRRGDPAGISLALEPRLVTPEILICYEEDQAQLLPLLKQGDLKALVNYLRRGWQFRPDLGDHDRGPEPLKE